MKQQFYLSAACVLGAERVLAQELGFLGFSSGERTPGRVYFSADATGIIRALINLRTADRLFLQLGNFPAGDFDALFDGALALPWEQLIGRNDRLVVEKARCLRSQIDSQSTVQAMVQKAAYDRLCGVYKLERMPETGPERAVRARMRRRASSTSTNR